jgi:hypothetical protein
MANTTATPRVGVEYPIILGQSLLSNNSEQDYVSIRYNFRPSSVSRARTGLLSVQQNGGNSGAAKVCHGISKRCICYRYLNLLFSFFQILISSRRIPWLSLVISCCRELTYF